MNIIGVISTTHLQVQLYTFKMSTSTGDDWEIEAWEEMSKGIFLDEPQTFTEEKNYEAPPPSQSFTSFVRSESKFEVYTTSVSFAKPAELTPSVSSAKPTELTPSVSSKKPAELTPSVSSKKPTKTDSEESYSDLVDRIVLLEASRAEDAREKNDLTRRCMRMESQIVESCRIMTEMERRMRLLELNQVSGPVRSASVPAPAPVRDSAPAFAPAPVRDSASVFNVSAPAFDPEQKQERVIYMAPPLTAEELIAQAGNAEASMQAAAEFGIDLTNKRVSRIIASIPDRNSNNPIAALTNFCKHQLRFDVNFKSFETSAGMHHIQVFFEEEMIVESADRKKKAAKEIAAKRVLEKINDDRAFLYRHIALALLRQV